uniref:Transposase Helix-turn-helix domain-containing protein n=1 Tax=Clytia hemisphaerica TaxID=252671 RepID=A0A7M5UNU7_9CNID
MTLKEKTPSSPSKAKYRKQCLTLTEQLKQAQEKISKLETELAKKENLLKEERKKNIKNLSTIYDLQATEINYETLTLTQPNEKAIEYLCGIDLEKFNLIFDCIQPYTHLIPYPDNRKVTKFSLETQLLVTLTICRHGMDQKLMAFILNSSPSTLSSDLF